ncbi:MAG: hypothetical protein WCF18_12940 [Chthoniobacteraceae bacterium]
MAVTVAVGFLSLIASRAEDSASDSTVRAWLEPKSMRASVALPIVGAQRTEIAFGRLTEDGLEAFAKTEAEPGDSLLTTARANAAADLATLKPRYVRDRHKVIQYAELHSTQPIVASAVLAPKFLPLFKDTLGETVLVVVPNRYTAYAFPSLATRYQEYYPMVFAAYGETAYPVSVEVFEFSANGIRAVGVFDRP